MMLITRVGLKESDEKKIFDKLALNIKGKGKINKTIGLGKKQFSYRIKKESEGNYWLVDMLLETGEVAALNSKLFLEENITRFLILRKEMSKTEEESGKIEVKKVSAKGRSANGGKKVAGAKGRTKKGVK